MSTVTATKPFTMTTNKREAEGSPDSPATKRAKTDMEVDEGTSDQDLRNKAFLEQVKKVSEQTHELSDPAWPAKVWCGKRYNIPKYQSRRVDIGVGPPKGNNKTPQRFQLRVRGRLDSKYGSSVGQWGTTVQVNVDGVQAQVAAVYNKLFEDQAIDGKWHAQHASLLKQGDAVLRSKVKGVFKLGGEKLQFIKDDNDKKIPDPEEPGKFKMKPHDPPQTWPTGVRAKVPDNIKPEYIVNQDGMPVDLSEGLNGTACVAVIQFTFVSFPSGDIHLGKELVALRVNTEDCYSAGGVVGGGSGDDSFF